MRGGLPPPTDLRPSPAIPSQPHHTTQSYECFYLRQRQRVGALQSLGVRRKKIYGELPRIPLPRTPVNKGERMSCWKNTGRDEGSVSIMGTTLSVGKREVEGE